MPTPRSRFHYTLAALVCIGLGLATRPLKQVAEVVGSALGDALWAMLVFLLLVLAFPCLRTGRAAVLATFIAWTVELSQLYHVGWLDNFRRTTPGTLTIGGSFSLGDMGCYLVGTVTAFFIDRYLQTHKAVASTASSLTPPRGV